MKPREELEAVSAAVRRTLEEVSVPSYVVDRDGDKRGERFTVVIAPEHSVRGREQFARKLLGTAVTDFSIALLRPDGSRVEYEFSSVPLRSGHRVVGVFGLARPPAAAVEMPPAPPDLTPRQHEV